ncbi:hypothetical protein SARC_10308, partial [Sphaeroforma arctica JP610]
CSIPCFRKHKEVPCDVEKISTEAPVDSATNAKNVSDTSHTGEQQRPQATDDLKAESAESSTPAVANTTNPITSIESSSTDAEHMRADTTVTSRTDKDVVTDAIDSKPKGGFVVPKDAEVPQDALNSLGENGALKDLLQANPDLRTLLTLINSDSSTKDTVYLNGLMAEAMENPNFQQFAQLCMGSIQQAI